MVIKECHLQGGHYLLLKYIIHLQDLHVQTMWKPHENHLGPMWKPHENHVGDMCKPHGNHVGTIANHVQTMCKTTWKPCWGHVQTMCKPCANHVQTVRTMRNSCRGSVLVVPNPKSQDQTRASRWNLAGLPTHGHQRMPLVGGTLFATKMYCTPAGFACFAQTHVNLPVSA